MGQELKVKAEQANQASILMASSEGEVKNLALEAIAEALDQERSIIIQANQKDLEAAKENNISQVLQKRLKMDDEKIDELIQGIKGLVGLDDPVGATLKSTELDEGLELYCVSCPIGVLGVIFESRPDALVQIASLCLKSGNAVLLKGGKEAMHTNVALYELIKRVSEKNGIPEGWVQLLESREDVKKMLDLEEYINLIIPRGSNSFVQYIMENTKIPVLGHADGICHVYIDEDVETEMAVKVAFDSKCQYPAVCNAMETLIIHEKVAPEVLPLLKKLYDDAKVELVGDKVALDLAPMPEASEVDWDTEYNDLKLSIKVVKNMDEAISHINRHGSKHTDAIVTRDKEKAKAFMNRVDSANVFWNCSTRFADGYRYGLGAEVGIATSKIHSRGPVGMEGLLIYKWKLLGHGHIVADYTGNDSKRSFSHQKINKDFFLD